MNRAFVVVVGLLAGLTGCADTKTKVQGRSQIGEDVAAADADAVVTVGLKTSVGNTEALTVSGVGLVYRLPGTGSSPPPGGWRTMLENNLKKQGFDKIKELLDDPGRTTSLVMVSALIPPGARKGDPIDVQITLPDESKTSSLKGGLLLACDLTTHDTTGNVQSVVQTGRPSGPSGQLLLGNVWAIAQGPVVGLAQVPKVAQQGQAVGPAGAVAAADTEPEPADPGPPQYRVGRVWGGGRVTRSREFYLLLNPGDQSVRMAATVADRLCAAFHSTAEPNAKVAEAKSKELVVVNVPAAYRHNHYRFLLVARQVPVGTPSAEYRAKLETELLVPETTIAAAMKLEALGGDSYRSLRLGLRKGADEWVRFAAAEALAYVGQTDGAAELAVLAEKHPALRASSLRALASMDDGVATEKLVGLMSHPEPTLRYGAFVALRQADERNAALGGVPAANRAFHVHRVAPGSSGLVHLAGDRRSEVVVFGDVKLKAPFTLPVGSEFTVSMAADQPVVKVSRVVRDDRGDADVKELACRPDVAEVLLAVGKLNGGYGEAVEFLTRADRAQVLSAGLAADALPRWMTVDQMAKFAKADPTLIRADVEAARPGNSGPDLDRVGYDLPADADPSTAPQPAAAGRPPLSQAPGRIFGPKYKPEGASAADPVPPGAEPPAAAPQPGTLFGPKKPAAR
jgi:hypothetical protein